MKAQIILSLLIFIFVHSSVLGQSVYKTPSGKKYHLASCGMVENVSAKLVDEENITYYGLTPCKFCKPPAKNQLTTKLGLIGKAVGESASVRCIGLTQRGTRCKHKTKLANGYCYQHTKQNSSSTFQVQSTPNYFKNSSYNSSNTTSSRCGAKNKSGGYCKRKVKSGGKCYQHK